MASRLISVLLAAFLACQGNKVPPTNLEEGFGILMTSATCKMRNLYRGALRFIDENAVQYPELKVMQVDHVHNPKLRVFTSAKARDRSVLTTDDILAEDLEKLLAESEKIAEGNPEMILDREIGNMEPEEIEGLLLKFKVQKLPGLFAKDDL